MSRSHEDRQVAAIVRILYGKDAWQSAQTAVAYASRFANPGELLLKAHDTIMWRRRMIPVTMTLLWIGYLGLMLLAGYALRHSFGVDVNPAIFGGGVAVIVGVIHSARRATASAAAALAALDDPRVLPCLCEALAYSDADTSAAARAALLGILPRLRQADSGLLTARHLAALNQALPEADAEFTLVLLDALDKVGDSSSIAAVQAIAIGGCGNAAAYPAVRSRATATLELLRRRAEHDRDAGTLLRLSSAPEGNLLRPVASTPPNEAALLRAAATEEACE